MRSSPPQSAYLVCATPRSGSTLLCETLRATGVAGNPLEHFEVLRHSGRPREPREYFAGVSDPAVLELLAPQDPPEADAEPSERWWARILREGTGANGVWGGKLMWGHVDDLLSRARELDGVGEAAGLVEALRALLGDGLRIVFVTRPDKVEQAVSLWRAVQTRAWRDGDGTAPREARYAFAGIDHLVAQLAEHDERWRRWFEAMGRSPLEVRYDALAADPPGTVAAVLEGLGLPADGVPAPATRRQGDGASREWAERYRVERAAVA
jgi:LPS sulfotransferase NodH